MGTTSQIICYSRTGHSRHLADQLADTMGGGVHVAATGRYGVPFLGWLSAGRDALRGHAPPLSGLGDMPDDSDPIVIVGPVWAGQPAAPLNTVADHLRGTGHRVAAALTCGDKSEDDRPLDILAERLGQPLVARLMLSNRAAASGQALSRIKRFAQMCKTGEEWQG